MKQQCEDLESSRQQKLQKRLPMQKQLLRLMQLRLPCFKLVLVLRLAQLRLHALAWLKPTVQRLRHT